MANYGQVGHDRLRRDFHRTAHLCRGRIVHRDLQPTDVVIRIKVDTNRVVVVRHRFDSNHRHVDPNRVSHDFRQHTHGIRHGHTCFSRVMSLTSVRERRKNTCSDVPKFELNATGVLQFGAIRARVNEDGREKSFGTSEHLA